MDPALACSACGQGLSAAQVKGGWCTSSAFEYGVSCPNAACVRAPSLAPNAPPRAQRVVPRMRVHCNGAAPRVCEWLPPLVLWREVAALTAAAQQAQRASLAGNPSGAWPARTTWGPGLPGALPGVFYSMALAFAEAGLPLTPLAHLCEGALIEG